MDPLTSLAIILILIFLVITAILIVISVPRLTGTTPAEKKAEADSLFVNIGGLNIHYKEYGQGPRTVILLHGFGASVYSWRAVSETMADHWRVIAFDRPAFGLTDRPLPAVWQGENPYSFNSQVELTIALMDALKIGQAILIGHSAGGAVATAAALKYPQRFVALVLVDAAIYSINGTPGWVRHILDIHLIDKWGPYVVRIVTSHWFSRFLDRAWHHPEKISQFIREGYWKPFTVEKWDRALWELIKAAKRPGLENQIGQLQIPVLVISGDDDQVIPVEESLHLSKEIPGATLQIFSECGHIPHEECPQAFLDAVQAFIEAHF